MHLRLEVSPWLQDQIRGIDEIQVFFTLLEEFQKGYEGLLVFELQIRPIDSFQHGRPFDVRDDLVGSLEENLDVPRYGFLVARVGSRFVPVVFA